MTKEAKQEARMTPELMKELEGILPVPKSGVDFTPDKFIEKKIPKKFTPVFKQRPWTKEEEMKIFRASREQGKFDEEFISEMARITIIGWYLPNSIGETIEFKADSTGACDPKVWDEVKHGLRAQCYNNAEKLSGMGQFVKMGLES